MKKKWSVKVNFKDGSFLKSISKLNYREEGILEVIYKIEKKFPKKNIISVQSI
ncbi:hypothetical protein N9M11_05000 [Flavobacteriaceae bacterium]|jgi:hypothetical protein|uniref:hypothetical protein n=1 Tax=Candidatus Arcticimaribacter forsetii TaxID=2820661 RepID=UPI0020773ABA|nr:hypothetical protein [Candidatus Arcticimaribacter forsetii]MDA8699450.1 hypothetical protein [Flavobacteriaceae bacterium]MDB2330021.1 hypothetical protein [Flavobacteriaceae bacterium]MDB2346167.1 hypothetical protein [Flavobacteriaceae bacterium]|tara:strand:- start:149 stop:307 length:159 start_codon:yes stop_codon:yes gene_type:complete